MGIRGALQYVRYPIGQELPLHPLLLLYQPIPIRIKQFLQVLDLALKIRTLIRIFHLLAIGS